MKVKVPEVVNKLNLIKGKPVSIDDIELKLTHENSYYDVRLKKRVLKTEKAKESEIDLDIDLKEEKVKEQIVLDNRDIIIEGQAHSSDFLSPRICTRLWMLGIEDETGWGWFATSNTKYSFKYFCRPIDLLNINKVSDKQMQYDREGAFITHAYYILPKYKKVNKLGHELLETIWRECKQGEDSILVVNCLIDSMLIKWKDKF